MTAKDVYESLEKRYRDGDRYALFREVANGTGATKYSSVDVLVVWLWPSDGLRTTAFEIKVSRGDFLRELQDAKKNRWAKDGFSEFYYVAPADVIKKDEVPADCGWMQAQRGRVVIKKACPPKVIKSYSNILVSSIARSFQREIKNMRLGLSIEERKRFHETDPHYRYAILFRDAVLEYLERHKTPKFYGLVHGYNSKDEILNDLESCSARGDLEQYMEEAVELLERVQDLMAGSLRAHLAITQSDMRVLNEAKDGYTKLATKVLGDNNVLTNAIRRYQSSRQKDAHKWIKEI